MKAVPVRILDSSLRKPVAAVALGLTVLMLAPACALGQFQVGITDFSLLTSPDKLPGKDAEAAMRTIDGTTTLVAVDWGKIAPSGRTRPIGFEPANPSDPHYDWRVLDYGVKIAAFLHLRLVFSIRGAPPWAQPAGRPPSVKAYPGTPWDPDATQFGYFAHAVALRYSGRFPDPLNPGNNLPRVNLWEIWNEPNLPYDLTAPNLVGEYRALLNAAYGAIKSVHPDSVVSTAGLAPVSFLPPLSISPLKFAAQLLCLRRSGTGFLRSHSCRHPAHFDVFAMHPYSLAATPTKHAYHYDDVLIGDMQKIADVLAAADRLHTVAPRIRHHIWVTEWSWFTDPPNRQVGDSGAVAARYVAYSMYEMWHSGVTLVLWFLSRDPYPSQKSTPPGLTIGGGLYSYSGRPKPMLRAFAFPVVASVRAGHGFVWGRAPVSSRVRVVVERRVNRYWRRVKSVRTGADGVFSVHFRAQRNGLYRARINHGIVSLAYDSRTIPPRRTHAFYSG